MASPKGKTTKKADASAATTKKKKHASSAPAHASSHKPSYHDMVKEAILHHAEETNERGGASRQYIKSFMQSKYDVDVETGIAKTAMKKAIDKAVENGEFLQPHGASGKLKLPSKAALKKKQAEQAESEMESEEEHKATKKTKSSTSSSKSKPPVKEAARKRS